MKLNKLLATIFSSLLLILVLVNILLMYGNQSLQSEVNERQHAIGQAMQLEALQRQVVNVLAEMAVKTNDVQLRELLTASGFTLNTTPEAGTTIK